MTGSTDHDTSPLITRRRVLGAAAAGASALGCVGYRPRAGRGRDRRTRSGAAYRATPTTAGIEHVVVVMMENRSFDHMLGWLPGSRGRPGPALPRRLDGTRHDTWHLDTFTGHGFHDPNHSYDGGRQEFNGGHCNGWLQTTNNDIYSIGYYTGDDLAFYGNAAPYWTTCDRFFASIMGPTYPNRFYMHAAQTDRQDEPDPGRRARLVVADDLGLAAGGGPRRSLLLLRPAVHRALGRHARKHQRAVCQLPDGLQQRRPATGELRRSAIRHDRRRPAGRRSPTRRHSSGPAFPERGLRGGDQQPELADDAPRDHVRRVGRLLRSLCPQGRARREPCERPTRLSHPDAPDRATGPPQLHRSARPTTTRRS